MKYIFASFLLIACKDSHEELKFKKYYIEVDRKELNLTGSGLQNGTRFDSSYAHNDSAAYIEGAKSYRAVKKAHEMMTERGVKISAPPTDFRVLNDEGENIEYNLSSDFRQRAKGYAENTQGTYGDALLDSLSWIGIQYRESRKKKDL